MAGGATPVAGIPASLSGKTNSTLLAWATAASTPRLQSHLPPTRKVSQELLPLLSLSLSLPLHPQD